MKLRRIFFECAKGVVMVGVGVLLMLGMIALIGCLEAQNMMQPVVSEPADTTPPAMVGGMKKPEETPATKPEKPAEQVLIETSANTISRFFWSITTDSDAERE